MKGNRLWFLGAAAAIVAIVLVGWLLGISPRLAEASAAAAEQANVEAINAVQTAEIAALRDQREAFDELDADVTKLRASVPESALTDDFADAIAVAAAASGAVITQVSFAEPGAWGVAAGPEGAPVPESTDGADTPPFPTAPEGVYTIAVTIKLEGEPGPFAQVSRQLQLGTRLFVISSMSYDANESKAGTINGFLFVVRDPSTAPPAEDIETETPTPTPTPEPTETPSP